ncbi:MAG: class B sortase [Ruminococcus sp.]|jgi:sortase B
MKKRNKIIFFLCLAVFLGASAFGITYYLSVKENEKVYEKLSEDSAQSVSGKSEKEKTDTADESEEEETPAPEIPVDFSSLQALNQDIYGWIQIPGTGVDYPIVQSGTDDSYYLNHTVEGTEGLPGAIYTESYNGKDFFDGNTVIYGHNMRDGTMFGGLSAYADALYMAEHSEVVIYTPEHKFTYQIFAAVTYDNRHILHTYDCNDRMQLQAFLNSLRQEGIQACWNDQLQVTGEDRIITLSTCNNNDEQRFLVEAVLIDEE